MPQLKLNLQNLKDLDYGTINAAFEHHLTAAVNDCYQRPEDGKERKVTMTFNLTPELRSGTCDSVLLEVDFTTKVPVMKTKAFRMTPTINRGKADGLLFHPDLPEDPEGRSIQDLSEGHKDK